MSDIFDLLDKEIDDLADLPEFKAPDTGIYKLSVTCATKPINEKPAVVTSFTVREVVELADSSIEEKDRAKAGDKFDVAFILKDKEGNDSEIAWGRMKEFVLPFKEHFGLTNLKEVIQKLGDESVDITAKVTKKERKSEKGVFDARVSDITID